jgi:glycosyltransferase involved in cell wall biosynthesis
MSASKPVRVLIITQYFWPEDFRINDLALGLKQRGWDVSVLTGKPNYPQGRYFDGYGFLKRSHDRYEGIQVVRIPLIPRGGGGALRLMLNYLSFALLASVLAPLRCRERYDAIFVYEPSPVTVGIPAIVLKKIRHAPIFFWIQDLWPESLSATGMVRSPLILRSVERLVRYIYNRCDCLLVQSRAFTDPVKKHGVEQSRIAYFPNCAEELYQPVSLPEGSSEYSLLPTGFRVMFAGNIGSSQDFETILAAAERIRTYKDIHWIILGDGRMATWVKQEIQRRGLSNSVHLLGKFPVSSMPKFFSLADVMLVTLKRDPIFALTIPSKIQSYLACGRPIIAALDGEGARIVEESGAGVAVPAEDSTALADALLNIYRMLPHQRAAMGTSGRSYFLANFERNMLLDRLDRQMKEFISKR